MKKHRILTGLSTCAALLVSISLIGCGPSNQAGKSQQEMQSLTTKAEQGDARAQFDLAMKYANGDGVDENQDEAFAWFKKSAEQGNNMAMVELGKMYRAGDGVSQDSAMADMWMKKAADAGNAEAQYRVSMDYGYVLRSSVWILGKGKAQEENSQLFLSWLGKSASLKYPEAQYDLGMTYLLGATDVDGPKQKVLIPKDIDKGLALLQDSANAGYYKSQWALAVLYQAGYSKIQPNKTESDKYWAMFESQTDSTVQNRAAFLYREKDRQKYVDGKNKYKGKALNFDETNSVAFELFNKSALQGNKFALYNLGLAYLNGEGVYKDPQKGIEYLKQSADANHYGAMSELGFAYLQGNGTVKDYGEAYRWLLQAANEKTRNRWSDAHKARNAVGVLYEYGGGVDKDNVLAYAWYNIAMSGGYDKAKDNLSRIEKLLNADELREAQTISREWKPGKSIARLNVSSQQPSTGASSNGLLKPASMGTGFYINSNGHLVTNYHVVEGCKEIKLPNENVSAKLVVADKANDLALLSQDAKGKDYLKFSSNGPKQGEEIFVFGFPLDGYLPTSGNVTTGIVSALAGPSNNSSIIQITAPVQPGNSGGPVIDRKGNVVGIVVGKADALKVAKVTGDIPQNVNFAISDKTAKAFLDGNKAEYKTSSGLMSISKDSISISEMARNATVKLECWK